MDKTEQTASKPAAEKPPEESAQSAATIVRKRTAAGVEEAIPAKKRKTSVALIEAGRQKRTADLIIDRSVFVRVVYEIAQDSKSDLAFASSALKLLHELAEDYLITVMECANLHALYNKRLTVMTMDMQKGRRLLAGELSTIFEALDDKESSGELDEKKSSEESDEKKSSEK